MSHPWEKKWILGERLGKGGQGVTCKVNNSEDANIHGALKYLKNNRDPQARGRMLREVASLQTLANLTDAVPSVLEHNTEDFENSSIELFVVMELISGPTLHDYVGTHGPLDLDIAIQLGLSICRTIEIAHTQQILHRDLKPENIIVRNENVEDIVIVDYGLSFNATDEQLTEPNETFRNRFLDLPETNTPSGDRRDQRSDLTAVCAILYFCLTSNIVGQLQDGSGTLPHFRNGYSLRDAKPDDVRITIVEEFLTKGFSPDIANRFQNVSEIVDCLSQLVGASKEIDESDPIQVAAAMSDQIRASDRKTQLAEFAEQAKNLFAFLEKEYGKYRQKLGRFMLLQQPGRGRRIDFVIPDGLDLVEIWNFSLTIQTTHHPQQRNRQYLVASRGEKCVLIAYDYSFTYPDNSPRGGLMRNQNIHKLELKDPKKIGWYEGNPEPIYQLASISYREWVTETIKDLGPSSTVGVDCGKLSSYFTRVYENFWSERVEM